MAGLARRTAELEGFLAQRRRQAALAAISPARGELAAPYAPAPAAELRARKRARLDAAGRALQDYARAEGVASGYEGWIAAGLNNAHLAAVSSCGRILGFQRLLAEAGGDLLRFYAAVRRWRAGLPRRAVPCAPSRRYGRHGRYAADGAAGLTSPRPRPASAPPPAASGS
ncbi:MAG: aminopeptidase [Steroidobacteraceae bacterium]